MTAQPRPCPGPEPATLNDLLARLARGDESALGELYDATCRWVYGIALRVLGDAGAAEEVVTEVYRQVWRRAAKFDPARGRAATWLLTMTRNRAIDHLRSQEAAARRTATLAADRHVAIDPRPDPESAAMLADRSALVRRAVAMLAPEQREVIELAFFEGLSHGQIARRLDSPLGTVKTRIRLGIGHLADRLPPMEQS